MATTELRVVRDRLDSPVVEELVRQVQAEYVVRYGGVDESPISAGEFVPPDGDFLVAWLDGSPVGCGGWRTMADAPDAPEAADTAELKRMYVVPSARRLGVARRLLAELEASAARAGRRGVLLETGDRQPEAIALYTAHGYRPAPAFGRYVDEVGSVYLAKRLVD